MDENYLDNLLNEISLDKEIDHIIEDELDSQMQEEKLKRQEANAVSREAAFNLGLEQDASQLAEDNDLHFSEEQMNELDQLDNLADLDIGDLDFSDIDFNDLDVTKLDDVEGSDFDNFLKDFEGNVEIDDLFGKNEASDEEEPQGQGDLQAELMTDKEKSENADLNEDTFDTDTFLDSLLEEETEKQPITDLQEKRMDQEADYQGMAEPAGDFSDFGQEEELQKLSDTENDELEDLFSLLDLEETSANASEIATEKDTEPFAVTDIEEIAEAGDASGKKKKTFMELLFGEPDEDDVLSEEELAQIEAKRAAKKAKKEAAKKEKQEKAEAAKQEKAFKVGKKKQEEDNKKKVRAEKRAKQRAEELADAEPEKKLNTPMVIFIFTLFLGGTFLFYLASNNFNYTQAVKNAANYFAKQKYHSAYDEIVGVEIKEKDQELKDRIYTVMYVERLYESYENNVKLDRQERALDALLRGVDKYYEYYEEAERLGITADLDYSFNQIQNALLENYGITVEQALEINKAENYEYVQVINAYIAALPQEETASE